MFKRSVQPNDEVKAKLLKRLRTVSTEDLLRWTENIHTGLQTNIIEVRKAINRNDNSEHVYLSDTRTGAVSLLAAIQVLEERCNNIST